MADDSNASMGKTLDMFSGRRATGPAGKAEIKPGEDFPSDFAELKRAIVRPAFENIGSLLKGRGHGVHISEESDGKISIHIVPAGVSQSIHPYDWFPTFSIFGAPFTRTVGFHGRNMRPNSEGAAASRGDYKVAQVSKDVVEKALMKFIGEIANW